MLKINQSAEFSKTISESDVYSFAGISGDFNPVHINAEYAKEQIFKERIAHGFLVGSLISTVIGTYLPGNGTIYLGQNMNFMKPVKIGDTVTARVIVIEIINPTKGIYKLKTTVENQDKQIVIDGEAVVMNKTV